MKKRTIWFRVLMLSILTGEEEPMMDTTNRLEAEETCDILNERAKLSGTCYIITKVLE